ncbi:MAG: nucleoside hydrolase [Acidimicrobiales bacterium]
MRIHVDSDFGGDPDDACALAMLLGWPEGDVEVVGITTNLEVAGRRAGCVAHYLGLAGRADIPVAAGAERALDDDTTYASTWGDRRYWPDPVEPRPCAPGAALDLLQRSVDLGSTILAIGAFTNLALLEVSRPGALRGIRVVAMAGCLEPAGEGFPDWGPAMDFNIQCDQRAAEIVAAAAELTLVTLPVAMRAQMRARDLPRLRASGRIGALLARQSEAYGADGHIDEMARAYPALADDLVNFHWDPVAAAVAAGWAGGDLEDRRLQTDVDGETLVFRTHPAGSMHHVATGIDADAFTEAWLSSVEAVDRQAPVT